MDSTQIIGFLAALFITLANIPQAYIIIRDKSTKDISISTYVMLLLGSGLWVSYGIIKGDWPIIISNSISTLTNMIILFLNFSSRKTINRINQSIIPKKIRKKAGK